MIFQASALWITAYSFFLIVIGELGDKSQLLAMAFATKYKAWKVLVGILLATVINHGMAIIAGNLIAHIKAFQNWIELIAAFAFIVFGILTLKREKIEENDKKKGRFGAIVTVMVTFFLAEIGDKTQLLVISLSANPKYAEFPLYILAGTILGMLVADAIGIVIGVILHKRIPDKVIKMFASFAFILFGLTGIYQAMVNHFHINMVSTILVLIIIAGISFVLSRIMLKNQRVR